MSMFIHIPIPHMVAVRIISLLDRRTHGSQNHRILAHLAHMPRQSLISTLVRAVSLCDLRQGVTHEELVIARGKDGGGDVDEDGDPGVAVVEAEGFAAEEDGGDDTCA